MDNIRRAIEAANRGAFTTAIELLRPLAQSGNAEAQYQLGFLALTECDLVSGREAFTLFQAAADQGQAEAMYALATFPEFVSEPFKSPLTAEEQWSWLLRAAESGCVRAQYDAGASLATGDWRNSDVVKQDLEAAVGWYRSAAAAGDAQAQFNLASMLAEGEGCTRDLDAAREWLRRSLASGNTYAKKLLELLK